MALIPKPAFPDVPQLPGVPQVPRSALFPPQLAPSLSPSPAAGQLQQSTLVKPQWGIFASDGVTQVVVPDSILDFGYRTEWNVSTFPVQNGSFADYNKVANPFEIIVRLSKGGDVTVRKAFLDSLAAVAKTLDLYTILTPEHTYLNCNVIRYEVSRRGVQGAYFFADVDVFFREIRQVTPQYSNTSTATENAQNSSAIPSTNQGKVQTAPTMATFNSATSVGVTP